MKPPPCGGVAPAGAMAALGEAGLSRWPRGVLSFAELGVVGEDRSCDLGDRSSINAASTVGHPTQGWGRKTVPHMEGDDGAACDAARSLASIDADSTVEEEASAMAGRGWPEVPCPPHLRTRTRGVS